MICFSLVIGLGCHKKVEIRPPTEDLHETWGVAKDGDDKFLVWAYDRKDEAVVKEKYCTKEYVCTMELFGKTYKLTRVRK